MCKGYGLVVYCIVRVTCLGFAGINALSNVCHLGIVTTIIVNIWFNPRYMTTMDMSCMYTVYLKSAGIEALSYVWCLNSDTKIICVLL